VCRRSKVRPPFLTLSELSPRARLSPSHRSLILPLSQSSRDIPPYSLIEHCSHSRPAMIPIASPPFLPPKSYSLDFFLATFFPHISLDNLLSPSTRLRSAYGVFFPPPRPPRTSPRLFSSIQKMLDRRVIVLVTSLSPTLLCLMLIPREG